MYKTYGIFLQEGTFYQHCCHKDTGMEQQDYLLNAHPKAGTLDCPLHQALDLVSHKWTPLIIYHLYQARGSLRFRQLQRKVGQVTQKELTKRLRELEDLGLISRHIYPEVPPRVEYRLTEVGAALIPPLKGLAEWAEHRLQRSNAKS
jgi:DNA-binding HxlR family transcriptional regulator